MGHRFDKLLSCVLVVVLCGALVLMVPVGAACADAGALSVGAPSTALEVKAKAKTGWRTTKAGKVYYKKGKMLTDLQKIGGSSYYFSPDGLMLTSDVSVGATCFYSWRSRRREPAWSLCPASATRLMRRVGPFPVGRLTRRSASTRRARS